MSEPRRPLVFRSGFAFHDTDMNVLCWDDCYYYTSSACELFLTCHSKIYCFTSHRCLRVCIGEDGFIHVDPGLWICIFRCKMRVYRNPPMTRETQQRRLSLEDSDINLEDRGKIHWHWMPVCSASVRGHESHRLKLEPNKVQVGNNSKPKLS